MKFQVLSRLRILHNYYTHYLNLDSLLDLVLYAPDVGQFYPIQALIYPYFYHVVAHILDTLLDIYLG